jgi:tetratricopeptide (TPR) repeat protein
MGYFMAISPDNPIMALFRGRISREDSKVIIGPYPLEADFIRLKSHGVTTVISLLDPKLPYENTLLARERELARKYQMELLNFPMISIFGKRFGSEYEQNAAGAAEAATSARGKVYLHCYLGLHRVKSVAELLKNRASSSQYLMRSGERSADTLLLDQAQGLYERGEYRLALQKLEQLKDLEPPALLLKGWTCYRLNDLATARKLFEQVLRDAPDVKEARVGLAYCAMRDNDLAGAAQLFATVLEEDPRDVAARTGLGLTRYRQGKLAEAADHLEAALKLAPEQMEAREVLTKILADLKR